MKKHRDNSVTQWDFWVAIIVMVSVIVILVGFIIANAG